MSVTTKGIWAFGSLTPEQSQAIEVYVQALVAQGATDGVAVKGPAPNVPNAQEVTRTWTTINDATSWITYIADFEPISYEIIE